MNSKVLVIGDSHVRRMAAPSVVVDFFGVPGLNAYDRSNYLDILCDYSTIVFEFGGNDISQHPRRLLDPVESIGDTRVIIKDAMDWCRETGRRGFLMPIITRESASTAIHMLNCHLRKSFRQFMMPELPEVLLSNDNVHVTVESYNILREYVEQYAANL